MGNLRWPTGSLKGAGGSPGASHLVVYMIPGNIQQPTSNPQHPVLARMAVVGGSSLDVGCWMFTSFGSGVQSADTGIRGILYPSCGMPHAFPRLWGSIGVALETHWGRIVGALGWLWSRNRLPINTLCGGFDVALGGLRGAAPPLLFSTFCFLLSLGGGFARLFKVRGSRFEVQSSVFSISVPNTAPLSRLSRGGLVPP
jgi:hypothetical protein